MESSILGKTRRTHVGTYAAYARDPFPGKSPTAFRVTSLVYRGFGSFGVLGLGFST